MRVDLNFYGHVPMPDAGDSGPIPTDRRYGNADFIAAYENLANWAKTADEAGIHCMWFTEHHFQYEGYEVTPNLVLFGLAMAQHTKNIRLGQMFNVVPQWHPLRLAEDFAMADILTGGRMEFGVGRGTVPREAMSLGTRVASGDNDMSAQDDAFNREMFEEAMEVIKLAWNNERFSYVGKHFQFPPAGIPDRGHPVTDLTLIPKPARHVPIFQPVGSPDTAEYAPRAGHNGVFWLTHPDYLEPKWEYFTKLWDETHGGTSRPGEHKALVLSMHAQETREEAWKIAGPGHDEFSRFLAPYGRFTGYKDANGNKLAFGERPTLQMSCDQQIQLVDSIENVAEGIRMYADRFGVEHFVMFLDYAGLTRSQMNEQIHILTERVLPMAGIKLEPLPRPEQTLSYKPF